MPITAGYGRDTIATNISHLEQEGYPRAVAIKLAFNIARCAYFVRYPKGLLPQRLAYPPANRSARDYLNNGAPIYKKNPVRELNVSDAELSAIKRGVQKQLTGQGAAVRKAAALYTEFTGHNDVRIGKVAVQSLPKAVLAIGEVDGIMYSTVRDGILEKYIHRFKKYARPLLAASPDGSQLYLIGGSYNFTDRGIVDTSE